MEAGRKSQDAGAVCTAASSIFYLLSWSVGKASLYMRLEAIFHNFYAIPEYSIKVRNRSIMLTYNELPHLLFVLKMNTCVFSALFTSFFSVGEFLYRVYCTVVSTCSKCIILAMKRFNISNYLNILIGFGAKVQDSRILLFLFSW